MNDLLVHLRALTAVEHLVWLALLAALSVFALLTWRGRVSGRRSLLLIGVRAVEGILLTAIFFQPVVERRVRVERVPVAIVVDHSESMAVRDAGEAGDVSRWNEALSKLELTRPDWERLCRPVYYVLGSRLKEAPGGVLSAVRPDGPASDFARIGEIPRKAPSVRAVFFFSDGRAGGGRDPAAAFSDLGIPVYAIGVGKPETAPDVLLASLRAPHFAFKNTDVEVVVRVEKRNITVDRLTVQVLRGDESVAAKTVEFAGGDAAETVLVFRPDSVGLQTYSVRLPVYEKESNRKNNSQAFTLDVSRDRVRVLYISGQPGPHYAFLRHQLKTNPSVELVSFVILRDPEDAVGVPDNQLALIPFPTQDVLVGQMNSFDIIVLEQFAFSSFGLGPSAMAALRDYVEKGGGLLLIGNARMLGPAGPYVGTPVAEVLPFALDSPLRAGPQRYILESYAPDHPLMAIEENPEAARALWARMPALDGDGQFLAKTRPGAVVVAGCPAADGRLPVLAAWTRGRGRAAMFLSLTSWRWALEEAGRGQGAAGYQKFWNNLLRWLSASREFRLVRLSVPNEPVSLGEEIFLKAFVRDENYRPMNSAQVRAVITDPAGAARQRDLAFLGKGEYADAFVPEKDGLYRVSVRAFSNGRKLGEDSGVVRCARLWVENRDTSTDFPSLTRWASAGGGEFVPAAGFSSEWLEKNVSSSAWSFERREAVWNAKGIFAVLILLLFGEWLGRRRWGKI